MRDIYGLLMQGLALGLAASASPGPFQAYLINQALANGFRGAAPVAFAPLIADIPIVIASLLLLDQLSPELLRLINIAGGVFVLYLAFSLGRGWRASTGAANPESSQAAAVGAAGPRHPHEPVQPRSIHILDPGERTDLGGCAARVDSAGIGIPARFLCRAHRRFSGDCRPLPPGAPAGTQGCPRVKFGKHPDPVRFWHPAVAAGFLGIKKVCTAIAVHTRCYILR